VWNRRLQPGFSFAPVAFLRQRTSLGSGQALELSVSGLAVLATADLKADFERLAARLWLSPEQVHEFGAAPRLGSGIGDKSRCHDKRSD